MGVGGKRMNQADIDQLRSRPVPPQRCLIGGRAVDCHEGATLDVVSPIDGRAFTTLADAGAEEVDLAVAAARAAYDKGVWSRRARRLSARRGSSLSPISSRRTRSNSPCSACATTAPRSVWPSRPSAQRRRDDALVVQREALGVVGVIVPWNFPLMIGAWKIAPALAAGNSVVVKPSEIASLTLPRLAELALEADIPHGVFNV
jgi:4-(gamma-glutamylamino)butanal dehydrogenase